MANVNSTEVANFYTAPKTMNAVAMAGGKVRTYKGTKPLAVADLDAADTVMLAVVPSNLRVEEIRIYNDDLDSNGVPTLAAHVGVYKVDSETAPTVKDADVYATAVTQLQAANLDPPNVAFEARDIIKIGNRVWEDAGDTVDPGGLFAIGLTFSTGPATGAAGDISWVIRGTLD